MPLPLAAIGAGVAAAGAIGNIAGGFLDRKSQRDINQKNIDFARENNAAQRLWERQQMEYQNKMNLDFWNMQNAYNNPAEQVKRMREAGLNPALLYGSAPSNTASDISAASGGASRPESPNLQAPRYGDLGLGALQGALMQQMQFENQKRLTDAQIDNLTASANKTVAETPADTEAARKLKDEALKAGLFKLQKEGDNAAELYNLRKQQSSFNADNIPKMLQKITEEIANITANREYTGVKKHLAQKALLQADVQRALSKFQLQQLKDGINPNDPGWYKDVKTGVKKILDRYIGDDSTSNRYWIFGH